MHTKFNAFTLHVSLREMKSHTSILYAVLCNTPGSTAIDIIIADSTAIDIITSDSTLINAIIFRCITYFNWSITLNYRLSHLLPHLLPHYYNHYYKHYYQHYYKH